MNGNYYINEKSIHARAQYTSMNAFATNLVSFSTHSIIDLPKRRRVLTFSFILFDSGEARKRFKTYVYILSTIKNENNEKYLILRKRYFNECPVDEEPDDDLNMFGNPELLQSPGSRSGISFSEHDLGTTGRLFNELSGKSSDSPVQSAPSPYKEPPPYKPPPKVMHHAFQNQEKYGECVDEFRSALHAMGHTSNSRFDDNTDGSGTDTAPKLPPKSRLANDEANYLKQQARMNLQPQALSGPVPPPPPQMPQPTALPMSNRPIEHSEDKENISELPLKQHKQQLSSDLDGGRTLDKQISVKEATKKFNKIASEEEASKIISPTAKKRPEKVSD